MRKKTQQNQSFQVVYENVTEFEKALLTNQNTASHVLVLDVHATWCGKCNSVLSTFEKINMDYGDEHQITFGILDSQKLVAELNEIMKPAVRLGVPIMSARGSSKNLLVLGEDEVLSDEVKAKKLYKEDVKRKNYKALLETFVGLSEPHFLIFKEGELIRKVRGVNTPMIHKLIVQLLTNEPTEHPEEPKVDKHAEVQLQIEPEKEEAKPVEEKKMETPVVEEQKEEVIVEQAAEELKTETIVEETKVETAVEEEKKEETLAEQTTETKTETEVKTETKVETTTTETKTETTVDTTATTDTKTEIIEEKKVESSEAKTDSTAATECKSECTTKTTEETQAKQETTEIHEEESKVATESVSLETVEHSTDNHDITTTEKTTEVEAPPRAVDGIVFEEKHVETVAVSEEVESHGDQEVETKTETEVKTETKVDTTATTETKTETTVEQKVESSVETKTDTDKTVTSDIKTETTTETK